MITDLTPEQEAWIPVVRDKWRKIALDHTPTNKEKAEIAINNLYQSVNLDNPEIIWFDNPIDACLWLGEKSDDSNVWTYPIKWYNITSNPDGCVQWQLHNEIKRKLGNRYYTDFTYVIYDILHEFAGYYLSSEQCFHFQETLSYSPINYYDDVILADYYNSVGIKNFENNCNWEEIIINLGFGLWWALYDMAVVTIKPSIIRLDSDLRLHADGEVAFQYEQTSIMTKEEFEIYACHGNIIPEKYGYIKYEDWQSQWLAKQKDSRLKWILAKEIGYHKLVKEFPVVEVRTWNDSVNNFFHECILLRVKSCLNGIFFLKVVSFDRDKNYFCLLPENIYFVRQAEKWVKAMIYSESKLSYICNNLSC